MRKRGLQSINALLSYFKVTNRSQIVFQISTFVNKVELNFSIQQGNSNDLPRLFRVVVTVASVNNFLLLG